MKPDWSTAPSWARYWAMDSTGYALWYESEPMCYEGYWVTTGEIMGTDSDSNTPNPNWRESLQERPEGM